MKPDAVTHDLEFPDVNGQVILDHLKRDPDTLHILVHIVSADEHSSREHASGAIATTVQKREELWVVDQVREWVAAGFTRTNG